MNTKFISSIVFLKGYDDWVNNSSANAGASASADAESVNVKTVNFAAEIEVETTNVSSSKLIVKQERIISKVLPAKIVPKGKKGVITIKDEPGDSKAKSVETSSSISSNSNSSNYHESSDNRTENHDQSYYDVEEEYEGGHLNEDEVDDWLSLDNAWQSRWKRIYTIVKSMYKCRFKEIIKIEWNQHFVF